MVKKISVLLCSLILLASASQYLVKVELQQDEIKSFLQRGLNVIGLMNQGTALLNLNDDDLQTINDFDYEILEINPRPGDYYLVIVRDEQLNLNEYGIILIKNDNEYLIKINPSMLEKLTRQKVMLKRLNLNLGQTYNQILPEFPEVRLDPTIEEIVNLVDPDTVLSYVQRLQDFVSRYSTFDSCLAAANYIASKFTEYGCDSVFFQYHTGGHAPNVIGVKYGLIYPDSIYCVISSHFDATSSQAPQIAPGADDNGSGTAAVIEASRVMQNYDFEYSVRYCAFSGEEFGLYGSEYYASQARSQGDSILGVFNGDMIGYVDALPESVDVMAQQYNPPCGPLVDFFIAAADTYTTLLTRKYLTNGWIPSDNQSFNDYGYLALLNIEDFYPNNPHYHQPSDTIGAGYNNNDFCTEVTKAEIAALSILAVPYTVTVKEQKVNSVSDNFLQITPTISRVGFTLSLKEPGDIIIYDALGREIAAYKNITQLVYRIKDKKNKPLNSGVYFVQVKNSSSPCTKKIVILP